MIKHLSIVLVAAALMTGCGGSDNKKTFPVSSMAASSTPASSTPASSAVATSSSVASNKVLKIALAGSTLGVEGWHQQVNQTLATGVVAGKSYTFSYKVKASKAITLSIQNNTGDDTSPTYISMPTASDFNVTTEWQQKSVTFTSTVTDATVNFQLNLAGQGDYDLYFDDISFTDSDGSNEQITNGTMQDAVEADFAATTNGQSDGGTATISFENQAIPEINKVLKIALAGSTLGVEGWHQQVNQTLAAGVEVGKSYTFSYKVKASKAITLSIQNNTGDDTSPTYISMPTASDFNVTTEWQQKTATFTATVTDATVNFQLNLAGQGDYDLYFDDISFTDEDGTNEQITHGTMQDAVEADFAATTNGQTDGGTATITFENQAVPEINKVLKIALAGSTLGVEGWHQQVNQTLATGVELGKSYTFSYKVKASKAITLSIQNNTGDDTTPTYISMPEESDLDVTTEWQQKSATFISTVTDATVNFQLNLAGQGDYDLYFDDISFTDEDGTNEQITHGTMQDAVEADFAATTNGQTDGGTATITFENKAVYIPE